MSAQGIGPGSGYTVDPAMMQAYQARLISSVENLKRYLRVLTTQLSSAWGPWAGAASTAHQNFQGRWNDAQNRLNDALDRATEAVRVNQMNYVADQEAGAEMYTKLPVPGPTAV